MPLEEPQLNGRIASLITELTAGLNWTIREELGGALRGPRTKPDILITRPDAPPIVLENEYDPARTIHDDCLRIIGRDLDPATAGAAGRVSTVIAIRSPRELRDCDTGDEARQMLSSGTILEYAAYQGTEAVHSRFPQAGYIAGNIRNLVEFIRPAAEPRDAIDAATQALEQGTENATQLILLAAQGTDVGISIGEQLRQPWPAAMPEPPKTNSERRQARADRAAREQTAKMCAAIIINALAYQQNLAGYRGIKDLEQVQYSTFGGRFTKRAVLREWDNILNVNYWPIFHIARELLLKIPSPAVSGMLPGMVDTAIAIQDVIKQNDVAGTVFQRLIADRKTLKTYYTRPESTTLAAHLAIPEYLDWSDPDTLRNYHTSDYACGTGGLLLAAYQRVRELHRNYGGDPDALHAHMMETAITGCDIMPAAVHLTSSLLSSVASRETYDGTRCILYPFGGRKKIDDSGDIVRDKGGDPINETDKRGRPVVDIGSLNLLNIKTATYQAVLPLSEEMALAAKGRRKPNEVQITPMSQSLVIMNPPFTKPTKHAPRTSDHVDPTNPAFAAFGTTDAEQRAMKSLANRLGKGTIGDGNAGLGTQFAAVANSMVKPNGHIALILPLSAMLGGSYEKQKEWSWQKLRRLLADGYNDIIVVSIAQHTATDSAFSADTDLSEVIVIARRLATGERPTQRAHFVNLNKRPNDKLAAQETARAIRQAVSVLTTVNTDSPIVVGDTQVGRVSLEQIHRRERWTTARVIDVSLARRAKLLGKGDLTLPQRRQTLCIPMTPMGQIGRIGPLHRDIVERGPFTREEGASAGIEWPMLWSRNYAVQSAMATLPDSAGVVKDGQGDAAYNMWKRASHLHINIGFGFNSSATVATYTVVPTLGGRAWPNLLMDTADMEKAICVWLNGTLGIITYWIESNRTQDARGVTTITSVTGVPILDVTQIEDNQLLAMVQIYNDLCQERMLPANEAYQDPVRQELDRRLLTEVLGLDAAAVEQLRILRYQWCAEPTVVGTKRTGPNDCEDTIVSHAAAVNDQQRQDQDRGNGAGIAHNAATGRHRHRHKHRHTAHNPAAAADRRARPLTGPG